MIMKAVEISLFFGLILLLAHAPNALGQDKEEEEGSGEEGVQTAEDTKKEKAKEYFLAGVEMFQKQNYKGAIEKFKTADKLDPNWKTKFNIGMCHFELKEFPAALSVLSLFVEEGSSDASSDHVDLAINAIVAARSEVFTIRLFDAEEDVKIEVDGEEPMLSPDRSEVFLTPGKHRIRIWSTTDIYLDETISGVKGEIREYKSFVAQEKVETGPGSGEEGGPKKGGEKKARKPGMKPMELAGWILLGVAGGALIGGAVSGGLAINERNQMEDLEKEYRLKEGAVPESELEEIKDAAWDHYDKGIVMSRAATALFAVGGAVGAAAIALLVTSKVKGKKKESKVEAAVSVSPMGLVIRY
jgi:hypothetical protein